VPKWLNEFSSVKRLLWDLNIMKYRVKVRHQVAIKYCKEKPRQRRKKVSDIEASLGTCEERCNESPTAGNQEELEMLKIEYDLICEQITKV